jgi:hypothetical protein
MNQIFPKKKTSTIKINKSDLAEIKQQGESKLRHPEPPAHKSVSTPHYTEKTGGLLSCQMLAPNLLGKHLANQPR